MQGDTEGNVLLTGATGFLGMELLARYLQRTGRNVLALVRAHDREQARTRIDRVLRLLFGRADADEGRVIAIPGDVERDRLGLAALDCRPSWPRRSTSSRSTMLPTRSWSSPATTRPA
jgi:thioester reductase-like protein